MTAPSDMVPGRIVLTHNGLTLFDLDVWHLLMVLRYQDIQPYPAINLRECRLHIDGQEVAHPAEYEE